VIGSSQNFERDLGGHKRVRKLFGLGVALGFMALLELEVTQQSISLYKHNPAPRIAYKKKKATKVR
jgi:hypothetical protein